MKIILLRHEERNFDIGFFSQLTEKGILNTLDLSENLNKLNKIHKIKHIYSSPFVRTLQTIFPYSYKYNKKVNAENALYEYIHNPYFAITKWDYSIEDINDKDLKNIVNKKYKSLIDLKEFNILENEDNLRYRIVKFFDYLYKKHNSLNDNEAILLVSHMGVINQIKNIFIKKTDMNELFPMGHFEIYDIPT